MAAYYYWSSTSNASNPARVWLVDFVIGAVSFGSKNVVERVRAVRGGR